MNAEYLTSLIVDEVRKQYRSVRRFAIHLGIPQTTVASALKNGVGGTAYTTVVLMCKELDIKLVNYDTPLPMDDKVIAMVENYHSLDEKGQHCIDTVLKMEYERCKAEGTIQSICDKRAEFEGDPA